PKSPQAAEGRGFPALISRAPRLADRADPRRIPTFAWARIAEKSGFWFMFPGSFHGRHQPRMETIPVLTRTLVKVEIERPVFGAGRMEMPG
ncbi:MAG: hypothetical protein PVJ04_08085, partial [Gemmatimonadota bacterium]